MYFIHYWISLGSTFLNLNLTFMFGNPIYSDKKQAFTNSFPDYQHIYPKHFRGKKSII